MAFDPVCHKEVSTEKPGGHAEFKGRKYYFCSKACEKKFLEKPEHYTSQGKRTKLHAPLKTRTSCDFTPF